MKMAVKRNRVAIIIDCEVIGTPIWRVVKDQIIKTMNSLPGFIVHHVETNISPDPMNVSIEEHRMLEDRS